MKTLEASDSGEKFNSCLPSLPPGTEISQRLNCRVIVTDNINCCQQSFEVNQNET